jgi:DNA-binding winged helix-turn-helix (wHTH) protein/Tol biopolymer transport system component
MSKERKRVYRFGPFCLDSSERTLMRDQEPVALTLKAFDILVVLVQNSGRVLHKDKLMNAVWADTAVEESNLSQNIYVLRRVLGQISEGREFIETVPRVGYRFAAPVEELHTEDSDLVLERHTSSQIVIEQEEAIGEQSPAIQPQSRKLAGARPQPLTWLWAAIIAACIVAGTLVLVRSPMESPKAFGEVQLTHFGRVEVQENVVTDGTRLYFIERRGTRYTLAQVSVAGGDPVEIPTPFSMVSLFDISPSKTELLIGAGMEVNARMQARSELWVLPILGGSPRRLGGLWVTGAAWSPDGKEIAYTDASDLYLAGNDGSAARRIATAPGLAFDPRWSPDGSVIRFEMVDESSYAGAIWEVANDGSRLHDVSPERDPKQLGYGEGPFAGRWTEDGRYYLFVVGKRFRPATLWAQRIHGRTYEPPTKIYEADATGAFVPGFGGRKAYWIGAHPMRELCSYDTKSANFSPFLGGPWAGPVSFSEDGKWLAYVDQGGLLLRSKIDGSERRQLTIPPLIAGRSVWSPDGSRIAFDGALPGQAETIFVISSEGGNPEPISPAQETMTRPSWSPAGDRLLYYSSGSKDEPGGHLAFFDVKTGHSLPLAGGEGLAFPSWSPDGRYIAARTKDAHGIVLRDMESSKGWQQIFSGISPAQSYWSADSQFLYFQDLYGGEEQPIFRFYVMNGKLEEVTKGKKPLAIDVAGFSLQGLTPAGTPIVSLFRSNANLYSVNLDLP